MTEKQGGVPMIYLTNDAVEQAVYFDLRKIEPRKTAGGIERRVYGLLGNGMAEVTVTIRSWRDCMEVSFGKGLLFDFIEERVIRKLLGVVVQELAVG
jgi:hypothetical protein